MGSSKVKILVVEDSPEHLADAKCTAKKMRLEIITASDQSEARKIMIIGYDHEKSREVVNPMIAGVVTDIFMPLNSSDKKFDNDRSPCGILVAARAQKAGLPFVFCTNGYHHGADFQWIESLTQVLGWERMVDVTSAQDGTAAKKNWKEAFERILKLIAAAKA